MQLRSGFRRLHKRGLILRSSPHDAGCDQLAAGRTRAMAGEWKLAVDSGRYTVAMVRACLEQSSLDLIAVDGPVCVGVLLSAVEFQVGAGTDSLDQRPKGERFTAVGGSWSCQPALARPVPEGEAAADAQQQVLVRNPPVVAHTELGLDPDQARLVRETPGLDDVERFAKKSIGSP